MDVGRVPRQKDPADAVAVDLALVDAEMAQPDRIVGAEARSQALIDERLDLLQAGVSRLRSRDITNDPETIPDDREEGQDPVRIPDHRDLIGRSGTIELDVRQDPIRFEGLTAVGQTQPVPHGAVGAIAAQQIAALHRLLTAICSGQFRTDTALGLGKVAELELPLDLHAPLGQQLGEHRLGAVLGNHQGVGEWALNPGKGQGDQQALTRLDPGTVALKSGLQERLHTAMKVQQFQGARPDHEGLGAIAGLGSPIDETDRDVLLTQGQSQGEAHGARSHHQDGLGHQSDSRSLPKLNNKPAGSSTVPLVCWRMLSLKEQRAQCVRVSSTHCRRLSI